MKIRKRGIIVVLLLVPVLFAATLVNDKYFLIAKNLDIFSTLFRDLNAHYVDEVKPSQLIESGIEAMLGTLDPYTNYIPEEQKEAFRTMTTGQYAGIGILVAEIDDKVKVTRVYEGFSADRAGIKVGDVITEVEGTIITSDMISSVGELLRGLPSSSVSIRIQRPPDYREMTLEVMRENIRMRNVPVYSLVNTNVGYIRLEDFTVGAGREVQEALIELRSRGASSVILDLRGNGGGLLREAANISNLFIDQGLEIVSTRGRKEEWNKVYTALSSPIDTEIPLVVLVDEGSASASEVVAGVLQDYDRAVLIGRRTFGKGLVQTTRMLPYDAQLKVTTARYYIPSGRCIQEIEYGNGPVEENSSTEDKEFRTRNGRRMYDGSGLQPDITVEAPTYSAITRKLSYDGVIFDYAVDFHYRHPEIASPGEFDFNDALYEDFLEWLGDRKFEYVTMVESHLTDVVETAKKENYYNGLKKDLEEFEKRIAQSKEEDLLTFRDEISKLIARNIAGTYYKYRGEIESGFRHDPDILTAVGVLSDRTEYRSTLGF